MRIASLLFCLLLSFYLSGQTNEPVIFKMVDEMPYFPGCSELEAHSMDKRHCSNRNLIVYISDYLRYPEKAKALGLEGTVYIDFIITETGKVFAPKIVRDIGGGCGDIALEIVKDMPDWEPGIMKGNPVKVLLNLPVKFSLKDSGLQEDMELAWGTLVKETVTRPQLLKNMDEKITVRDEMGNDLEIIELSLVYKKGRKIKEAKSRGNVNNDIKKLLKKMKRGGQFVLLTTVQYKGKFIEVERSFSVI